MELLVLLVAFGPGLLCAALLFYAAARRVEYGWLVVIGVPLLAVWPMSLGGFWVSPVLIAGALLLRSVLGPRAPVAPPEVSATETHSSGKG